MANDISDAFGIEDEPGTPIVSESSPTREQGLTELHQVKADALATVRPLRELTVDKNGLKAVTDGRKAVVKLRTSVDKRRKLLNEEAKNWIDTVNGTAKEILSIIEPVELYLKGQEAEHERRQREAADAERRERVELRRSQWPTDAGAFPELEAGELSALDWTALTIDSRKSKAARDAEDARIAAEQEELAEFRRAKAEADRQFAERLALSVATKQAEQAKTEFIVADASELSRRRTPTEPPSEPVVLPVSEGVGRLADELRETWPEPLKLSSGRDAETRLADLIRSLRYLVRMQGEVDWRGQIAEAIADAQQ